MELDNLWNWKTRKLACRIRLETGNPAGDDLRERLAELGGVDLKEVLTEMKANKKKKEQEKLGPDHETDAIFKALENRSHILGATQKSLAEMQEYDAKKTVSFTQNNINKVFTLLPKSPPKRLLKEIQRERARPLKLPDQDGQDNAHRKLQRKLARERALKKAELEDMGHLDHVSMENSAWDVFRKPLDQIFPPYGGDKFGTGGEYIESMIYMSRSKDAVDKTTRFVPPLDVKVEEKTNENDSLKSISATPTNKKAHDSGDSNSVTELGIGNVDANVSVDGGMGDSKLYCAMCLCDWSRNPLNSVRLAQEGAVRALCQLFLEPNTRIVHYCAAGFRYMSEQAPLALAMLDEGAISTIGDMIQIHASDDFVLANLAMTLVNLTKNCSEAQLVEGGIVLALMNLMAAKSDLSVVCARGLYNLTCVDTTFHNIERLIRALVSLSSTPNSTVKHICAAALCNLSDMKLVRPRLVEEGTVNVLTAICKGSEPRTRRICAIILQNLTASKGLRSDIVSRGGVAVAFSLSADSDPVILRAIGFTLSRLAKDPSSVSRMISEQGMYALSNIVSKNYNSSGITQPVAVAYRLLSAFPVARTHIVQEAGGVGAIGGLLRSSTDLNTILNILVAVSNLLLEKENHTLIIQQGLILLFIGLQNQENDTIADLCSLVFLNFTLFEESMRPLVNNGAATALVELAKKKSIITKRRCAIALCRLTNYEQGIAKLVDDGAIPSLVGLLLSSDFETIHNACVGLCNLCCDEDICKKMLESGIVKNLVQGSSLEDITTKQYCLAVLSTLSYYDCARIPLLELGIMAVLKESSTINDSIAKQRCLLTYANLSCEPSAQVPMVEDGVITIAAELAESYQEVNYMCCAKVMCNLSCNTEICPRIAKDGGVYALLMISMVHSVDKETKLVCVMALNNLLRGGCIETMLKEGVIAAIVHLSKIADERILKLCAKLLNQISLDHAGRKAIVEKSANIHVLVDIMKHTSDPELQVIALRTACNLLQCSEFRSMAIEFNALSVLEIGLQTDDKDSVIHVLNALMLSCCDEVYFRAIASSKLPVLLSHIVSEQDGRTFALAVGIFEKLFWGNTSRSLVQKPDVVGPILNVVNSHASFSTSEIQSLIRLLRFIVEDYSNHKELLALGFLPATISLGLQAEAESLVVVAEIFKVLCQSESCDDFCLGLIADVPVMELLRNVSEQLSTSCPDAMLNLAIVFFTIAKSMTEIKYNLLLPCAQETFSRICKIPNCKDYILAALGLLVGDKKSRDPFCIPEYADFISNILNTSQPIDIVTNSLYCISSMSKVNSCRLYMFSTGVNLDHRLMDLSVDYSSTRLKSAFTNVIKSLTSDSEGALEEGKVSSLIIMSLDGQPKKRDFDGVLPPKVSLAPVNLHNSYKSHASVTASEDSWACEFPVMIGGCADKGPELPEAPKFTPEDTSLIYQSIMEEQEGLELEGKSKMAFAKMAVPNDFRSKYTLPEQSFLVNSNEPSNDSSLKTDDSLTLNVPDSNPVSATHSARDEPPANKGSRSGSPANVQRSRTVESKRSASPSSLVDKNSVRSDRPGSVKTASKGSKSRGMKDGIASDRAAQMGLYR